MGTEGPSSQGPIAATVSPPVSFPRAPAETLDFFASDKMFEAVAEILELGGALHLASNVEDVALQLLDNAMRTGRFLPLGAVQCAVQCAATSLVTTKTKMAGEVKACPEGQRCGHCLLYTSPSPRD